MNLRLIYLHRNLARNPLRTALTCIAVALPVTIFVLSMAVVDGVNRFLNNSVKQLRLVVTHKASIVNPLPEGYIRKIQALDPTGRRLRVVCGMNWIGGQYRDDPYQLSTLAVDHEPWLDTYPEYQLDAAQKAEWLRDRQAIVVGNAVATQFKWKIGDRITIKPSLPPYSPLEFHVISIGERNKVDRQTLFCRRDYVDEVKKEEGFEAGLGKVSFFFIKCDSAESMNEFQRKIDLEFANTPDETKTQDEKAFMNEFIQQQFDLPKNLTYLCLITVFVAVMAAMNTMSMNFRDRLNEFATLKSLGFRTLFPVTLITAESVLLCLLGGVLGAAGPFVAFGYTPLREREVPLIQVLDVTVDVCGLGLLISLAIGLIAGLWPAWLAARMHVVGALRSLE